MSRDVGDLPISQAHFYLRLANDFLGFKKYSFGLDSPMTAMSRDHGDYPIFLVSTQSVTLTMGRL
jgi:hypothetical protein